MPSTNLRSVVAQCFRLGGRSSQTRNFSSSLETEGVGGRVVTIAGGLKSIGFFRWMAYGYAGFFAWETWALVNYYFTAKRRMEEFELRKQLHEELVAKAMHDLTVE